jgi:hypothetical protein
VATHACDAGGRPQLLRVAAADPGELAPRITWPPKASGRFEAVMGRPHRGELDLFPLSILSVPVSAICRTIDRWEATWLNL